ncbi:MAG: hypothetical protein WC557_12240, partial [Ignavibacteriaceae bacterium]
IIANVCDIVLLFSKPLKRLMTFLFNSIPIAEAMGFDSRQYQISRPSRDCFLPTCCMQVKIFFRLFTFHFLLTACRLIQLSLTCYA